MSTLLVKNSRLPQGGQQLSLNQVKDKLEGVLNPQIASNTKRYETLSPSSLHGRIPSGIYERLQNIIHRGVAKIAETPAMPPQPAAITWTQENLRLRTFYSHLNEHPKAELAFGLCEKILKDADRKIRDISKSTTASASEQQAQQMAVISKTRESIGKVVFAFDRVEQELDKGIDLKQLDQSLQSVDQVVKNELDTMIRLLTEKNDAANAYGLQDLDMATFIQEPKEIAKILLTSSGQLNLGMIGAIKEHFFPTGKELLEYQQGIVIVLDWLDATRQPLFDAVETPKGPHTATSTAMVRATVGLLLTDEVTKLHCQQVVLGGLLSQLNQGSVGNCFVVSWLIKKHNEFFEESLKDYIALVRDGYLTRMVNGQPDLLFYKNTISVDAMTSQFTLNPDGTILELNGAPFWECPNLIAACLQMGLTELDQHRGILLQQLFSSKSDPQTMNWDQLIQLCAKNAVTSEQSEGDLLALGRYGFSLGENHLFCAWEGAGAAMAEDRPGDYVRDNIVNSVMTVADGVFAKDKVASNLRAVIERTKALFQKTLNDAFRLPYNAAIPLTHVSSDGSSSSGGFELYERDLKDLTNIGVRIATPEQFRTFIQGCINRTSQAALATVSAETDVPVINSVIQALHLCTIGKDFLKNILYAYEPANKNEADPVANYLSLERTPMTSLDGDNPWEVESIDTGKDFTPDVRTIRPKDPEALLKWLLGLAKWKEATEHYLSDKIPNEEVTATSPQHAFNIEIEGPEFVSFLSSKLSEADWIKKTLVDPGKQISKSRMSNDAKQRFAGQVNNWLSNQQPNGIPSQLKQQIQSLFTTLNSPMITVQQFAQRSHDGLIGLLHLNADQKREISLVVDGMLLQALPAEQLNALQKESVRFAKTNWDSGPRNIFFCCFYNIRTSGIGFASVNEDKTGLRPMDEVEWIDKKQWEVDPAQVRGS